MQRSSAAPLWIGTAGWSIPPTAVKAFPADGSHLERYSASLNAVEINSTFYRLPRQHHKNLKSTNLLERLNEEIKRRTLVVRIFPNTAACLRLVRALAVEMHENWIEATRYLNMEYLKEQKKEQARQAA